MSMHPTLARIKAIAFDFDGVSTDDRVIVSQPERNQWSAADPTAWESTSTALSA